MKIYCLQHDPHVTAGTIPDWASSRNVNFTTIELYNENFFHPEPDEDAALIILGGPMNIYETEKYPFLNDSRKIIKDFIDSGNKVLGICLGAQLISDLMGAKVVRNDHKEIGWWEVQVRNTGLFADYPPLPFLFHWHEDVFELPEAALLWASTGISSHQAYTLGENVMAVQFHPEVDEALIATFLNNDSKSKKPSCGEGPYSQSADEIRTLTKEYLSDNKTYFFALLDNFFGTIEGGPYKNRLI
jgi:GMP synthase-like glutamine amidotransferase